LRKLRIAEFLGGGLEGDVETPSAPNRSSPAKYKYSSSDRVACRGT